MGKYSGAIKTGIVTFFTAVILSSTFAMGQLSFLPAMIILLVIIGVGIIFDLIGTSVTAADEGALHAMAADRVPGARWAIYLVRRADRVANICNDVIGDICGTTSGASGAALVVYLSVALGVRESIMSVLIVGLIAALTVGGKAAGKNYAINEPESILLVTGRAIMAVDGLLGNRISKRVEESNKKNRRKKAVKGNGNGCKPSKKAPNG
ncbi:MAG TPA: hypothetical protein DHD79_06555 [Firmicutes bacterium]|nr:hypothetical protein [Bacillota bacterium]HBG44585.1 hypothetical protein [Bacillota bacterium]HBL69142.1 hypothetical protein [Bacillota bacterium]HBR23714.1 hypothetical protein [Bacillota bacterium]HCF89230.1 hypothetical protein [Bacillota bacterium]